MKLTTALACLTLTLCARHAAAAPQLLFDIKEEFFPNKADTYEYCAMTGMMSELEFDLPPEQTSMTLIPGGDTEEMENFTRSLLNNTPIFLLLNDASSGRFYTYPNMHGADITHYVIEVPYWFELEDPIGSFGEDYGVILHVYGERSVPEPTTLGLLVVGVAGLFRIRRRR